MFTMKAKKEDFFRVLSEMEKQPLDPMELVYPKEIPLFEKYDEYIPAELVKKGFNPSLEIQGVILSMFDGRTNLSIQVVEEVKKFFQHKVYNTVIPRNVRLSEAPSYGLPIIKYDPKCLGAVTYMDLAREFIINEEGDL